MRIRKLSTVCLSALGLTLALMWFLGNGNGLLPIARAGSFTVDVMHDEADGECLDDCSLAEVPVSLYALSSQLLRRSSIKTMGSVPVAATAMQATYRW